MANFASRAFAILALLAVCLDLSARPLYVQADDAADAPAADVAVADDAPAAEATEEGEAAQEGSENEAKGQEFVDSARELQEKLGQLRALLDAKGEGADPALKDRLAGLESQLKTLGLDGLSGAGGSNPELVEFYGACVAMSMRRVGMQRPATLGSLRKLAQNKLPPAEAAKNELWRMVAVCINEFKEDEFASFKTGKVKILPKVYVDASKKPEAEKQVLEIQDEAWEELRKISEGLLTELMGNQDQEKPPINFGYLALIPFLGFCGVMAWGFKKMFDEKEKKGKAKKSSKKSN